jgi:predicted phage terminase large subunit-like protein
MPAVAPKLQLPSLEAIEAELCRRSLHKFVERNWHLVEPMVPFQSNWHIEELCRVLEQVSLGAFRKALAALPKQNEAARTKIQAVITDIESRTDGQALHRVVINVPPGTMKSLLVSVFWPSWEWATLSSLKYLTASYSSHLTLRDNRRVRTIVSDPWYQEHFNFQLLGDQSAVEKFGTSGQGLRIATSVGGLGTGEHPDRIIIDDPITAQEARSDVERGKANQWFSNTIGSRGIARDVAIIVIMQRLHEEDLAGYLLERGGWEHVCFPMRFVESRMPTDKDNGYAADPRDRRTQQGELLWPSLLPEAKVKQLELDLGPYDTAGQLQQQPAPEGGGLFKREWFKFVDVLPSKLRFCRGWDTAGTEGAGDYTSGIKIGIATNNDIYVADVFSEQLGPHGVDSAILSLAKLDGYACAIREEKEPGSAGIAVIAARTKTLIGYDYKGTPISGDKVTRAKPFRAQCEAGNVYLLRATWNHEYIQQLSVFPTGKHDDKVDGSSCAFNALVAEEPSDNTLVW